MEVVVACFKVLAYGFLGGTRENHEKPQKSRSLSSYIINLRPPDKSTATFIVS
jgi:hypothetical protein